MQNSNKKSKECCDKCKDAPKCKPNCCLRHFHCANCPCHKPSNKKSKCCKECNAYKNIDGTDKFYWECNNPTCPCHTCLCHKPSVKVQTRIPLDRDENEEWESRLEKEFGDIEQPDLVHGYVEMIDLKIFIRELLSSNSQKLVSGLKEKIVIETCVLKEPIPSANDHKEYNRGMREGVELIRNVVINIINNIK